MQEEKELINFLRKSTKLGSQEILLMYYLQVKATTIASSQDSQLIYFNVFLQRSRYSEAMALNEQLNARPGSKERSATRQAIMDRCVLTSLSVADS
jgi:hypothetical protein